MNMPDEVWIYVVTFFASVITLLTGFGLATILTPVFTFVYDVKAAILLVAIVQFINNVFKCVLFRKHVNGSIIRRFGLLSIAGAVAGALLQSFMISSLLTIFLGMVLIALGIGEFLPSKFKFTVPKTLDRAGGFLSGFLGGLVGNQGAIRSAYLLNYEISKEEFIGTSAVIALCIDMTRIPIYLYSQQGMAGEITAEFILVIITALLGTVAGRYVLGFFSSVIFKKVVAAFVLITGVAFATRLLG